MNSHDDEYERTRPYDWQDKLVITASWICFVICLGILIWGK